MKSMRPAPRQNFAFRCRAFMTRLPKLGFPTSAIANTIISGVRIIPAFLVRNVPVKKLSLADGDTLVASVFDLFVANYGVDRGLGGKHIAKDYDAVEPYSPAWAEAITGVPQDQIVTIAREFAKNAEKTRGRSMVIVGCRAKPLVPHGYELSRHYQHAGDVRMRRPIWWRVGTLRWTGEAASANGMAPVGFRTRLEPPTPSTEFHVGVLRPYRSMALRNAQCIRDSIADRPFWTVGWCINRFQRACRAHGLVAICSSASGETRSASLRRLKRRA